jgi:hypothetical protein
MQRKASAVWKGIVGQRCTQQYSLLIQHAFRKHSGHES